MREDDLHMKGWDELRDYWTGSNLGFDTAIAEVYLLRRIIREAPHAMDCNEGSYRTPTGSTQAYCDCWKSKVDANGA